MKNLLLSSLLIIIGFCASPGTYAWGTKAHRVIGMIAEDRLTPAAQAAVNEILAGDDIVEATIWADRMRDAQDNPDFWRGYASNWHYVNIAPGEDYASSEKDPRGDAYMALQTFSAILLDEPVPSGPIKEGLELYFGQLDTKRMEVRQFALKFMLHLLGDLQQPLHSGYESDRGGNDVTLEWFGRSTNLHSIWDTLLLEQQDRSAEQIARRLNERIDHTPASDIRNMESSDPQVWMKESQRLLGRIYARHSRNKKLNDSYTAEFVPTVELQLVKGGLRTAYFLNSIFGGWPVGNQ
ncbi:MAG: S1/P1 nuclease [Pseudomonadota bacterium]